MITRAHRGNRGDSPHLGEWAMQSVTLDHCRLGSSVLSLGRVGAERKAWEHLPLLAAHTCAREGHVPAPSFRPLAPTLTSPGDLEPTGRIP